MVELKEVVGRIETFWAKLSRKVRAAIATSLIVVSLALFILLVIVTHGFFLAAIACIGMVIGLYFTVLADTKK